MATESSFVLAKGLSFYQKLQKHPEIHPYELLN
jgi:hypothetical protein